LAPPLRNESEISAPVYRSLRGYALDPSLAQTLRTAPISEIVFRLPWEELAPGPVGEYLEVIDYDPAARCFYEPVDLNQQYLLAQDGLPPSEGTPQFHQQMVYAVSQLTIHNFEQALGRVTLWAPGPPEDSSKTYDDSHYVQRLRIYPHALREANAYYSPAKKALLLGYFAAAEGDAADHIPGGLVFTAISHDIVAHETAHALLDGMHRRLRRATNPDMLAFHEGFADIVALFQHFTFPEIIRHQIGQTRGDISSQETVLGQLATQFGRATGARGALRDAIGAVDRKTGQWKPRDPNPSDIDVTMEPHQRGAILVAAVFEAFLSIYKSRVADLLRLYTSGTGVLPAGSVHPDLVNRLSDEAFRRRGLYPRDVRTLSAENLRWRSPNDDDRSSSDMLLQLLLDMREQADRHRYARSRKELFKLERETRLVIQAWLKKHFKKRPEGKRDAFFLGLDPARSFQVHSAHFASRTDPLGKTYVQLIAQLIQEGKVPTGESGVEADTMRFEGGSTLVANLHVPSISYCIRKPMDSLTRRHRQQEFTTESASAGLRSTYFPVSNDEDVREPFALLHRGQM
jgi:hypothetical protein